MSAIIPLPLSFFQRPTLDVSRELLGKNLCRVQDGQTIRLPVTEVEAYDGPDDLASLFEWTDNALVAMAERATERVTQRDSEARAGLTRILDLCP